MFTRQLKLFFVNDSFELLLWFITKNSLSKVLHAKECFDIILLSWSKLWRTVPKKLITFLNTKYFLVQHHLVFVDMKCFFVQHQLFYADMKHFFEQHQLVFVDTRLLLVQHETFCFDTIFFFVQHHMSCYAMLIYFYCHVAKRM